MAKRGRPKGVMTQEALRRVIEAEKLIHFLQDHALTGDEIDASRIDSAKFLISRAVSPPVPKDDDGKTPTGPVMIAWQP